MSTVICAVEIDVNDPDLKAIEEGIRITLRHLGDATVTAIVKKDAAHLDQYIRQQVIKAQRCSYENKMGGSLCDKDRGHEPPHAKDGHPVVYAA